MNPHGGAISVGFVQLLASMLSGLLIDTVGRIPLLITSSVFMSMALASFGSYVYYYEGANRMAAAAFSVEAAANNDWIPLLCVLVFTVAFSLGISPISSLLVAELFPLEFRGVGSSIATSFSYFCAFVSVKTFVDFEVSFVRKFDKKQINHTQISSDDKGTMEAKWSKQDNSENTLFV